MRMNEFMLSAPPVSRWRELWLLTKPGVVQLIVFCALIGMLLSLPSWPTVGQWHRIIVACIGIWLVASSAATINCLLERSIDARMTRTSWRPTARGALPNWQAIFFSAALCLGGCLLLAVFVNELTMWLTLATLIGYALIYTLILKPLTSQNIVIGGASGAMPPVLGWAAVHGSVGLDAFLLFLIIFVWTPPHFWALALYRVEDYRRSGLPMLPVTHGMAYTARHIFLYTIALSIVSVLPVIFGMSSWLYLIAASVLSVIFCLHAYRLWRNYSDQLARKTFRWSLWHLAGVFLALLLDHYFL
ncbi:heme o synthase [Alcaligenes sp. DN25]|nr:MULTISPECIES: heme o synthase [Alcaligenes]URW83151.1 heme o synthase [Alcaligenes sp. DN25]WEA67981.1 heme o synthase [Alcaligenes faecalis]